jgi:hypothetical protein
MPYEVCFTKKLESKNSSLYFNQCCRGGDIVRDHLQPEIQSKFGQIQTGQEDWGWFIWVQRGRAMLCVDIFCDEPVDGNFRIHLTVRGRKILFLKFLEDSEELRNLLKTVRSKLEDWGCRCEVREVVL